MSTVFKSVSLDTQDLLEQAVKIGVKFNDGADINHFLEFCEKVFKHGAEVGFHAGIEAALNRSEPAPNQMN